MKRLITMFVFFLLVWPTITIAQTNGKVVEMQPKEVVLYPPQTPPTASQIESYPGDGSIAFYNAGYTMNPYGAGYYGYDPYMSPLRVEPCLYARTTRICV